MGLYERHVLPRLIDVACRHPGFDRWRPRATEGLWGTVVELGFGTGLNLRHYPDTVDRILAVEPSLESRDKAAPRIAARGIPVEFVGLEGESVPVDDDVADFVLSTYTLCTIPGLDDALGEVRRMLRPGGTFHLLEHGLSADPGVARWQHRLNPVENALAGGCHLNRDIVALVDAAGFDVDVLDQDYRLRPHVLGHLTLAQATVR